MAFDENLILREVIAGARRAVPRREIERVLEGYSDVVIKKARANPKEI